MQPDAMPASCPGCTCLKVGANRRQHDGNSSAGGAADADAVPRAEHERADVQGVAFPLWQPGSLHSQQLLQALQELVCITSGNDIRQQFGVHAVLGPEHDAAVVQEGSPANPYSLVPSGVPAGSMHGMFCYSNLASPCSGSCMVAVGGQ